MLLAITGFVMIGLLMFFLLKGKAIPMTLFVVLPILGAVINGYGLPVLSRTASALPGAWRPCSCS